MEQPKKDDTVHAKTVQAAQENNEHIYSTLPSHHIRVLDLLPGSELDLIEVQLHVVPVADPGAYKALSYMCGSTTDDLRLILCNGYEFMVTANLFEALTRFRDPSEAQRIWIDAICIHQGSISERSQQVRMMSQIYAGAEEVLVWLGEDSPEVNIKRAFEVVSTRTDYRLQCLSLDQPEGSAVALLYITDPDLFDLIDEVQQRFDPPKLPKDHPPSLPEVVSDLLRQSWADYPKHPLLMHIGCRHVDNVTQTDSSQYDNVFLGILPDWDVAHVRRVASEKFATFADFLKEATKPAEMRLSDRESAEVLSALNYLMEKPYFQRAWIVQETILAQTAKLVCGKHEVDFESFWHVFGLDRLQPTSINNFILDDFKYFEAHENVQKIQAWSRFAKPSNLIIPETHHVFNQMAYIRSKGRDGKLALFDIGALLKNFDKQKSTDRRDLIFGFVGLLQKFSKRPCVLEWAESCVDYSLDVRDVYLSTAKHIAENNYEVDKGDTAFQPGSYHILDFFARNIGPSTEQLDLPTWVPDWSAKREYAVFNTRHIIETDRLIPFDARVQGESLMISGCIVDEVTFCSEILDCNEKMFQEVNLCYMLVEQENKKKTPSIYGGFKAQFEGFWRTIIADNPIGTKPFTDHTYHFHELEEVNKWLAQCRLSYRQARQAWSNELKYRPMLGPAFARVQGHDLSHFLKGDDNDEIKKAIRRLESKPVPLADDDKVQEIIQSLDNMRLLELLELDEPRWGFLGGLLEMTKHILIKTKQGYFGLAPPGVQCGDTVALLAACSHPWYLRRQDQHYTIVGEAWVHGLMYESDAIYQHEDFRNNCTQIELR